MLSLLFFICISSHIFLINSVSSLVINGDQLPNWEILEDVLYEWLESSSEPKCERAPLIFSSKRCHVESFRHWNTLPCPESRYYNFMFDFQRCLFRAVHSFCDPLSASEIYHVFAGIHHDTSFEDDSEMILQFRLLIVAFAMAALLISGLLWTIVLARVCCLRTEIYPKSATDFTQNLDKNDIKTKELPLSQPISIQSIFTTLPEKKI